MINRLIKNFTFDEDIRSNLTLSDDTKIRLNSEGLVNSKIQLKDTKVKKKKARYSLDADLFVDTGLITPNAVQKWLGFEVILAEDGLPNNTSLGFKVKTSAGDRFWDGGSWAVAGISDWNTEAEINANIDTFPISTIGDRSIGFIVNLVTTDKKVTPKVAELKLLGEFDIEFLFDIVYDSVIRTLNLNFRSTSTVVFPTAGAINSIDLKTVLENQGYNIFDVKKVINLTDDPNKFTNLFDSYALGAGRQDGFTFDPGVVTFSSAIPVSKSIEITFEYLPEITIKTGQDFFEVPSFPTIVFESVEHINRFGFRMSQQNSAGRDVIKNKAALTGVLQFSPRQEVVRFEYAVFTNLQEDQMVLANDLNKFLTQQGKIKSWGLDCDYDLDLIDRVDTSRNKASKEAGGVNDTTDTNIATGSFDVLGVLFYDHVSKDVTLVGEDQTNLNTELI